MKYLVYFLAVLRKTKNSFKQIAINKTHSLSGFFIGKNMSNEKFTFLNDLDGNSTTQSFNVLSSKFGDGYEQHISVGINNRKGQWNYQRTGYSAEIKQIKDFFDRHKGADSFLWNAPLDGEVRVKADVQYQLTKIGGDIWRISTTFYQQF